MESHHRKHHQTYVNNVNNALSGHELSAMVVDELIANLDKVPAEKKTAVRNSAGGHANHSLFWKNLKTGTSIGSELKGAIEKELYYLKYRNRRPDYIKAFWNVDNWDEASTRYASAK